MELDLEKFKFLPDQLKESAAIVRQEYERVRRCVAIRKDGRPCQGWARWGDPGQLCAPHGVRTRRQASEITKEIRKGYRKRRAPKCNCLAYRWPHRRGKGLCKSGDPGEEWQTPASGKPRKRRSRGYRLLLAKAKRGL